MPDLVLCILRVFKGNSWVETRKCITLSACLPVYHQLSYTNRAFCLPFFHFKSVKLYFYFFLHWLLRCIPDFLIYYHFPYSRHLYIRRGQHNKFFTGSGIFGQTDHYKIRALGCEFCYKDLLLQGPVQGPVLQHILTRTELLRD